MVGVKLTPSRSWFNSVKASCVANEKGRQHQELKAYHTFICIMIHLKFLGLQLCDIIAHSILAHHLWKQMSRAGVSTSRDFFPLGPFVSLLQRPVVTRLLCWPSSQQPETCVGRGQTIRCNLAMTFIQNNFLRIGIFLPSN